MTLRYRLPCTFAVLFVVGIAAPASAQEGFWWWLERLSGPGPYQGWGASVTPVCVGAPKPTAISEDREAATDITIFTDYGCGKAARDRFRAMLRFEVSWAGSDDNPLVYDPPWILA
jgi:hypothetical protein